VRNFSTAARSLQPRVVTLALALTLVLAFAAASCTGEPPASQSIAASSGALRVLFLGNSYTYYHNLPRLVEEFAAAAGGRKIETRMIAPGGASLADHLANRNTLEAIRTGRWDFVVLQEQSQLGAVYLVNGEPRVGNAEAFFTSARALAAEIHKAGATPVLFHTWPRREAPDSDRAMLDYAYTHLTREIKALRAPVGPAWMKARTELRGASLYADDGSHPSTAGSYLAAAVLYATLTGTSPVGGPARISGAPVNLASGAVATGSTAVLVDLPARFAGDLQRIAWDQSQGLLALSSYPDLPGPAPLALPQVPTGGRRPAPGELTGRWIGSLRLYPQPAILELWIAEKKDKPGEWTAAIEIRFTGGNHEDLTHELEQFQITDTGITFVDPTGPNGGAVRYRAAFFPGAGGSPANARLTGVAEATVEHAPVYAIGSFDLKRIR
jgi:hypothetical protein